MSQLASGESTQKGPRSPSPPSPRLPHRCAPGPATQPIEFGRKKQKTAPLRLLRAGPLLAEGADATCIRDGMVVWALIAPQPGLPASLEQLETSSTDGSLGTLRLRTGAALRRCWVWQNPSHHRVLRLL